MSAKPGLVLFSPFSEILIKYRISEKHEFTIHHSRLTIHSVLKLLTGFADAALNVRIHNIIKAIINMIIPPAINTNFKKSFDNNEMIWVILAPITFRTPISFVR